MTAAASYLGTLPGWLTFAGVVMLALALRGGQLGPAVGYLREANATLVTENGELKKQNTELTAMVVELQAKTNIEPIQLAVIAAIDKHETASARRDESLLGLIKLIADRFGPEPNGA